MSNKPATVRIGDTSIYKTGTSRFDFGDPYHLAVTVGWPVFFAGWVTVFVLINLVFATLYSLDANAIANAQPHSLRDAFFFSMETLATVGYGSMAPSSLYGHIVSATEIICGLAFTAIVTGLIFVRFSKVKPKMLFADQMVINTHDGKPTLMVRIAYGRSGMMVAANARLHLVKLAKTAEGRSFRNTLELKLLRSHLPVVLLTWTVMHVIDEHSPLYGMSADDMVRDDTRAIVTVEGRDHSLASSLFDYKAYGSKSIVFNQVYQDLLQIDTHGTTMDVRNISLTQPE